MRKCYFVKEKIKAKKTKALEHHEHKRKSLEHGCDLVSIAKAALEHHMTYGKYVEMLEKTHEHGV